MKITPDEGTQKKIDALDEFRTTLAETARDGLSAIYNRLDEIYHDNNNNDPGKPDESTIETDTREASSSLT